MKFTVLTLFPEIPRAFFEASIMAKAVEKEIIAYDLVNVRDFALDKHRTCDDSPYGGGAGQLMLAEPLGKALDSVKKTSAGKPRTVLVPFNERHVGKVDVEAKTIQLTHLWILE